MVDQFQFFGEKNEIPKNIAVIGRFLSFIRYMSNEPNYKEFTYKIATIIIVIILNI